MRKYSLEEIKWFTKIYHSLSYSISRVSWSSLDEHRLAMDIDAYISDGFPIDFIPEGCSTRLLEQSQKVFSAATTIKLIEVGADVNYVNASGENALILEAKNNCWKETVPVILKQIQNVNAKDNRGHTALSYLCLKYLDCKMRIDWSHDFLDKFNKEKLWNQIYLLLDAGADPELDTTWQMEVQNSPKWQAEMHNLIKQMAMYLQQKKEMSKSPSETFNYPL